MTIARFQRFLSFSQTLSWGVAPGFHIPRLWRFEQQVISLVSFELSRQWR